MVKGTLILIVSEYILDQPIVLDSVPLLEEPTSQSSVAPNLKEEYIQQQQLRAVK